MTSFLLMAETANTSMPVDSAAIENSMDLTNTASLLLVIGEPFTEEHKDLVLDKITQGLCSWNSAAAGFDINDELINFAAEDTEDRANGERILEHVSERVRCTVLINPPCSSVVSHLRTALSSQSATYHHVVYAGHTFSGTSNWILQDDTFKFAKFASTFLDPNVDERLKQSGGNCELAVNLIAEGEWSQAAFNKQPFNKQLQVRVNPDPCQPADGPGFQHLTDYLAPLITVRTCETLLQATDVVGNIRFSRPTLYIFPGSQGQSALFGISGFNLLVDGGYNRKPCFWDFTRHLDRIDAMLLTHLGENNLFGMSSVVERKVQSDVHPEIGFVYFNGVEQIKHSPNGDLNPENGGVHKDASLVVNLVEEGQKLCESLSQLGQAPHPATMSPGQTLPPPINLYHKVGHGSLDMYVLNPTQDSKELKEFLVQWNKRVSHFPNKAGVPLPHSVSISALLVWRPAAANEKITRILFPGMAPQAKLFEGLDRLKSMDIFQHSSCSINSMHALKTTKKAPASKSARGSAKPSPPPSTPRAAPTPERKAPIKSTAKTARPATSASPSKPLKDAKNVKKAAVKKSPSTTPSPSKSTSKSTTPSVTPAVTPVPAATPQQAASPTELQDNKLADLVPESVPEPVMPEPEEKPDPEPSAETVPKAVVESQVAQEVAQEVAKAPSPQPPREATPPRDPSPEPARVITPEPVREPTPEPVREPTPEPVREPTPEPVREPTPEPVREPTPEPVREPTPEPVRDPTPEPVKELTPEPVREPTPEPVREPTPEPVREPTPEPVREPTPEPVREPSPEQFREPTPEVIREPTPEVIREPSPEQFREPTPEVIREPTPEVIREPTPEIIREPTPEVIREPTPEVIREPTPEVLRDPTPEPSPMTSPESFQASEQSPVATMDSSIEEQNVPDLLSSEPAAALFSPPAAVPDPLLPGEQQEHSQTDITPDSREAWPLDEPQQQLMDSSQLSMSPPPPQAAADEYEGPADESVPEPSCAAPIFDAPEPLPQPEQFAAGDFGAAMEPPEKEQAPLVDFTDEKDIDTAAPASAFQDDINANEPGKESAPAAAILGSPEQRSPQHDLIFGGAAPEGLPSPPEPAVDVDSLNGSLEELPQAAAAQPDLLGNTGSMDKQHLEEIGIYEGVDEDSQPPADCDLVGDVGSCQQPAAFSMPDNQYPPVNPFVGIGEDAGFLVQPLANNDVMRSDDVDRDSLERDEFDPLKEWGAPDGLPAPAPPSDADKKSARNGPATKSAAKAGTKKGDAAKKPPSSASASAAPRSSAAKKPLSSTTKRPTGTASTVKKENGAKPELNTTTSRKPASAPTSTVRKTRPTPAAATTKTTTSTAKPAGPGSKRPATSAPAKAAPAPKPTPVTPFYVDLTYIPSHGSTGAVDLDFFRRVRARYYVLSCSEPCPKLLDALVEAKGTWGDDNAEVTLIPTYDTDDLRRWMATNREQLTASKVDVAPSASRCTIQLQDHSTSCSAYRLEF